MNNENVILANFRESTIIKKFSQAQLNKLFTKFVATAHCVKNKIQNQQEANQFLLDTHNKMQQYALKENYIEQRKTILLEADFFETKSEDLKLPDIYKNLYTQPLGENIAYRMDFFQKHAISILEELYNTETINPNEIILVTNTGYESPNPLQKFISKSNLNVSNANCFANDCYAAFPAIEMATGTLYNPFKNFNSVDIVHIEFNSLHLNILDNSAENFIIMSLFGDGAIKYTAQKKAIKNGLKILAVKQQLIPKSTDQMSWKLGTYNFKMTLKPYVPLFIDENIESFLESLFELSNFNLKECTQKAIWAIHPGGPKIVKFIQDKLGLANDQVFYSNEILRQYGNMSSATIAHIWRDIAEDDAVKAGTPIVALAFGPGLTVYGMIMEKI